MRIRERNENRGATPRNADATTVGVRMPSTARRRRATKILREQGASVAPPPVDFDGSKKVRGGVHSFRRIEVTRGTSAGASRFGSENLESTL